MADIKKVNVGGLDYNVKDDTARTNASTALTELAYQETGNTASQVYAIIGTPINWKGTLYFTKTAVAKGATWAVGTNLTLAPNLGKLTSTIKTYVNSSGQLVFRDLTGADTVLPFSGSPAIQILTYNYSGSCFIGAISSSGTTAVAQNSITLPNSYGTASIAYNSKATVTVTPTKSGTYKIRALRTTVGSGSIGFDVSSGNYTANTAFSYSSQANNAGVSILIELY